MIIALDCNQDRCKNQLEVDTIASEPLHGCNNNDNNNNNSNNNNNNNNNNGSSSTIYNLKIMYTLLYFIKASYKILKVPQYAPTPSLSPFPPYPLLLFSFYNILKQFIFNSIKRMVNCPCSLNTLLLVY